MKAWTPCSGLNGRATRMENAETPWRRTSGTIWKLNRDKIEALTIFYAQPHRRGELSYAMIREILDTTEELTSPVWLPLRVWQAYVLLDDYKGSAACQRANGARGADPPRLRH